MSGHGVYVQVVGMSSGACLLQMTLSGSYHMYGRQAGSMHFTGMLSC